jgi:SAM-dependent methyltransferase
MRADPWLERWLPLIGERSAGHPVLELGCGTGRDTATLVRAGQRVVALDLSLASIALAKLRAPGAKFHRRDLRQPFPIGEAGTGVVIASLSLHYFPWPETVDLVERIRRRLRPNGILLCRLNSTKDRHFGAVGHERIAENFYRVRGAPKRFFDPESIDKLFAGGWNILGVQESVIDRYLQPKTAWEIVLERTV